MTTATRADIQAQIAALRDTQRRLPEVFARMHDAELSDLLDALLSLEPEPA